MNDISMGAVGAAIIAGLVSLLGLVISKEQKISEFRQAWIDDLRKCLVSYLVSINAISDSLRSKSQKTSPDDNQLISNYKLLNEASHGIVLRVNSDEDPSKILLKTMADFEVIASKNSTLTPLEIHKIEEAFIAASKTLLKFEWKRVKRGEVVYVQTKWGVVFGILLMAVLLGYLLFSNKKHGDIASTERSVEVFQSSSNLFQCDLTKASSVEGRRSARQKANHGADARHPLCATPSGGQQSSAMRGVQAMPPTEPNKN